MLAVLLYLVAFAIPVLLLGYCGARSWYWHLLAIGAALGLGFIPTPPAWKTEAFDLIFGFTLIVLLVWGIGGLVFRGHHPRREKHA
jgi:hypothetical protein